MGGFRVSAHQEGRELGGMDFGTSGIKSTEEVGRRERREGGREGGMKKGRREGREGGREG